MNEHEAWQQRLTQLQNEVPGLFVRGRTVLYIGATPFRFQMGRELFEAGCEITLLEIHKPFAAHYEGHPWLREVICGDVKDVAKIADSRKWDAVVWWHGPEHVRREELGTALAAVESVARKLVVVGSPWGNNPQGMVDGNPHSAHQSCLDIGDFASCGYEARTLGQKDNPGTWCHILAWKNVAPLSCVVYTAIFGGFDELLPAKNDYVPHVCFTDEPIDAPNWSVKLMDGLFRDSRRDARLYKVLAHLWFPDVDVSVWQDGCMEIKDLNGLIGCLGNNDLALFAHPSRDCVYQEAEAVIELGKAPAAKVHEQMAYYREKGYPENNGLAATAIVVRRHTESVACLNVAWWSQMSAFTARDQLSFDYMCRENGVDYSVIPGSVWDNEFCTWHDHVAGY